MAATLPGPARQYREHVRPTSLQEEQNSIQLAIAASLLQNSTTPELNLPLPQAALPSPFSHNAQPASNRSTARGGFPERNGYNSHIEPLEALLEDCTVLKDLSRAATSFRERCRELGAVGDEIKLAAKNAARKVNSEDSSIILSRILAACHKEVFLAQTRIEVYGMYSRMKKYIKIIIKRQITLKFLDEQRRLCMWLRELWGFVRAHAPAEFRRHYTELERIDDAASVGGGPSSQPSLPARRPHSTTELTSRRSLGRSLGSFTGSPMEASHPTSSITDRLDLAAGVVGDGSVCSEPATSALVSDAQLAHAAGRSAAAAGSGAPPPSRVPEEILSSSTSSRFAFRKGRGRNITRSSTLARRGTNRKLQVAHIMAKPVTALLFVDGGAADSGPTTSSGLGGGFVWWWTKGGNMHVHDVQSNNTITKLFPLVGGAKGATVRVLALDLSQAWVWAGHDDGMLSVWREATSKLVCCSDRDLSKELGSVTSIEPVARHTVAVGVESGRVCIVKLGDAPPADAVEGSTGPRHSPSPSSSAMTDRTLNGDGRKRIVAIAELRSIVSKSPMPGTLGASPAACAPPAPAATKRAALATAFRRFADVFKLPPSMQKAPPDDDVLLANTGRLSGPLPPSRKDPLAAMPSAVDGMSPTSTDSCTGGTAPDGLEAAAPAPSPKPPLAPKSRPQRSFQSPRGTSPGGGGGTLAIRTASASPPEALSKEASASQEVAGATPKAPAGPRRSTSNSPSRPGGPSDASGPNAPRVSGGSGKDGPSCKEALARHLSPLSLPTEDSGVLGNVLGNVRGFARGARAQIKTMATMALPDSLVDMEGMTERAHDNRVETILVKEPYLFTASSASSACDAQIRVWVQGRDAEATEYGLHDTFHCTVHRTARTLCVIPWDDDSPGSDRGPGDAERKLPDRNWRLLSGHDSGNVLLFDPRLPHLKPILTIQFPSFGNVAPRKLAVLPQLGLLCIVRSDGTVQLLAMITARSRIMRSAIDPTKKTEIMDGVVSLQQAGCVLRLHDKRIDHVAVARASGDLATATLRGNVSFWGQRLFDEKAQEAGLKQETAAEEASVPAALDDGQHGGEIFRVTDNPGIRSSTVLADEDLDIVDYKDVTLQRHLGNGAFGTVREAYLHHTPVAVKILKEGEVGGALGSLAMAEGQDLQDIRKNLVREVRILKGIRHPNVLFFRGICLQPPMIITELCDYGSVSDVIQLYNRMSAPRPTIMVSPEKHALYAEHMSWAGRVRLGLDAAKGMLYLHSKGLLHCDLKSLNLLVDKAWTCKVADFGLSRYLSGKQGSRNVPAANNPMWQAPEVIADSGQCTQHGDVYSFGVVMWELLMMSRPWVGVPLPLINTLVQNGQRPQLPSSLADVPGSKAREVLPAVAEYVALMQRCWHQTPGERPSFEAVVSQLEDIDKAVTTHEEKQAKRNQAMLGAQASEAVTWQRGSGRSSWQSTGSRRGSLPTVHSNASSGNVSPLSSRLSPDPAPLASRQPGVELDPGATGATGEALGPGPASSRHTPSESHSRTLSHHGTHSLPHSHSLPHVQPSLDGGPLRPDLSGGLPAQMDASGPLLHRTSNSSRGTPGHMHRHNSGRSTPGRHSGLGTPRRSCSSRFSLGAQQPLPHAADAAAAAVKPPALPLAAAQLQRRPPLGPTASGSQSARDYPTLRSDGVAEAVRMNRPASFTAAVLHSQSYPLVGPQEERSSEERSCESNPDGPPSGDRAARGVAGGGTTTATSDAHASDVHITIGNEIEARLFGTPLSDNAHSTMSPTGGPLSTAPLDSIPERNAREGWLASVSRNSARGRELDSREDTFGLVLPGQSGLLESASFQKDSSAESGAGAAPDRGRGALGADGMFHASMDSSAIASLPALESPFDPPRARGVSPAAAGGDRGRHVMQPRPSLTPAADEEPTFATVLRLSAASRASRSGGSPGSRMPDVFGGSPFLDHQPDQRAPPEALDAEPTFTSVRRPPSRQVSRAESGPGSEFMSSPFDAPPPSSRQASRQPSRQPSERLPEVATPWTAARTVSAFDVEPTSVRQASVDRPGPPPPVAAMPLKRQIVESASVTSSGQRLSELGGGSGGEAGDRFAHAASFPGMLGHAEGPSAAAAALVARAAARVEAGRAVPAGGGRGSVPDPTGGVSFDRNAMAASTEGTPRGRGPAGPGLFASMFDVEPPAARGVARHHHAHAASEPAAARLPSTFDAEPPSAAASRPASSRVSHVAAPRLASTFDAEPPGAHRQTVTHAPSAPRLASTFDAEPRSARGQTVTHAPSAPRLASTFDAEPPSVRRQAVSHAPSAPRLASTFDAEPPGARSTRLDALPAQPSAPRLASTFDAEPAAARVQRHATASEPHAPALASSFDAEPASARVAAFSDPPYAQDSAAHGTDAAPRTLAVVSTFDGVQGAGHHGKSEQPSAPRLASTFDSDPPAAAGAGLPLGKQETAASSIVSAASTIQPLRTAPPPLPVHSLQLQSGDGVGRSSADCTSSMAPSPQTPTRLPRPPPRAASAAGDASCSPSPSPSPRPLPLSSSLPLQRRSASSPGGGASPASVSPRDHVQPPVRSHFVAASASTSLASSPRNTSSASAYRAAQHSGVHGGAASVGAASGGATAQATDGRAGGASVIPDGAADRENVNYDSVELPFVGDTLRGRLAQGDPRSRIPTPQQSSGLRYSSGA